MFERLCVALCLLVMALGTKAVVTVENGSYQNVQIAFAPNITVDNAQEIIESLKDLLQNTSNTLLKATGLQINNVVFRLPATWDVSGWENVTVETVSKGTDSSSDIWIETTQESAFGGKPFAVQYGGCGVPGEKITIPVDFLNNQEPYPKDKLLAREWLKYRYGVFDENGFKDDPMYPAYYQIPGTTDIKITECTNQEVLYDYKDSNGDNCSLEVPFASIDCHIFVEEENAENVTSSLLYLQQELRNMAHICGKEHRHNDLAPNKQNTLCADKSIWEVLELSFDFHNSSNKTSNVAEVQITFVQETKPRIVVVLENTENLHNERDLVKFGVYRFLYDLPLGSKFGLYIFNEEVVEVQPLQEVATDRQVAIASDFVADKDQVNTAAALETAVQALDGDNNDTEGSIILIAGSKSPGDISEKLTKKLETSQVCVTIIVFGDGENEGYRKLFSDLSCSFLVNIPRPTEDRGKGEAFKTLYEAMLETLPQSPSETRTMTVTTEIMSSERSLNIPANPSVDKFTLWLGRSVESGSIVCASKEASVILTRQHMTANIVAYSFDALEGDVQCSVKPRIDPVFTQVQSTTKIGEYFDGSAWVHDTTEKVNEQMPVIIYARINYGNYPIQNAIVTAIVKGPEGQELESFELFDNGRGDPDITEHDGIYSRYFLKLEFEGRYSVLITAETNGNQTIIGKKGATQCCGSKVSSETTDVPSFQGTLETAFFARAKKPDTIFKPSKVMDLRVDTYDPQNRVILKWTAPGGEYDRGKASAYKFYMFCNSKECNDDGSLPDWVVHNSSSAKPKPLGEQEETQLSFGVDAPGNFTVLFGLKSVNNNNMTSDLSNLSPVHLGIAVTPTTNPPAVADDPLQSPNVHIIVFSSIFGLLLLVCVGVSIYFYVIKRRPANDSKDKKNIPSENGVVDISSQFQSFRFGSSMRRVESFPVLLYTHDQIKDLKSGKSTPQFYKSAAQPKPWLSLDALPKTGKNLKDGSDESASTSPIHDNGSEIEQLDDVSQGSEPQLDKVAKF